MRIAVLEPSGHGGLLHYSAQLAEALAARGHSVDLIAARGNELSGRLTDATMRDVLPLLVRSASPARSRSAYVRRRAGVGIRLVRAWSRMVWETRPGRYDAILHGADIALPPASLATLLMTAVPRHAPVVRIAHNVRAFNRRSGEELFDPSGLSQALLGRLYARFDLVLVHGEQAREELESAWSPRRVRIIPHGDERLFGEDPPPPSDEERVLFFGEWRKVKGLEVLMPAFDELARLRPNARLTVAGTPIPEDWDPQILRTWAQGHGSRVEVVDHYVPIGEVEPLFRRARVVTTPYLAGFQSGIIHLAATMGRAVVTSDVGDLGNAVRDGVTGLVVPPGDSSRLADALAEILAHAEVAERMGSAARELIAAESSWERVAELVEEHLLSLGRIDR